jgi:hypothetical protein
MSTELERLAYEAALRGLDKQEGLLEGLRARTGVVLAAASVGISLLGQPAFQGEGPKGLALLGLMAFVIAGAASVFILVPTKKLVFAEDGPRVYEGLFDVRNRRE